jgi:molybdopterin-guanine dinucleotide biosynthesis protein A
MVEPLHAVYRDTCLPAMRRQLLGEGAPRIVSFFPDVRVLQVEEPELRVLDPDLLSFFNINTPADLARAREILRRQGLDVE